MPFVNLKPTQISTIGQRLVQLRTQANLSAATVAREALGYENGSHVAVTRLERAILSEPRADHLHALARYYKVSPEILLVPLSETDAPSASVTEAPRTATAPAKLTPQPATLAERVQWVREAAKLDPETFALTIRENGAMVTSVDVLAWEGRVRAPNPIQLRALAQSTSRSGDWFVTGVEAQHPPRTADVSAWG